jgi:hypothetical protein
MALSADRKEHCRMIEKLARTAEEATLELVLAELAERRSESHEQDYVLRLFIKNAMLLGSLKTPCSWAPTDTRRHRKRSSAP